jgi:capsular polysaccharide biosynthesis protein
MVARPEIINCSYKIRSREIVEYDFPDRFASFFRRYSLYPDRFVYELSEAIIITGKGVVLTNDNIILIESIGTLRRLLRWEDIRRYLTKQVPPLHLERACYYLPKKPFFNFLLEELPALLYATEADANAVVIIGTDYPQYYHDALRLIFGDAYRARLSVIRDNAHVQRLLLTQRDNFSAIPHLNDVRLLNQYFNPRHGQTLTRIYVSRRKASYRKIANELEIESMLSKRGFEILSVEDFSLSEQIGLISTCECLISPHGAGLSHMIWNPTLKKTVLEIFPSHVKNDRYACLASTLGYTYDYLICGRDDVDEVCDLEHLAAKLSALGLE